MKQAARPREQFRSKMGFIMACIGSAVGMANIWLFPYRTGQYGGAAFLIPYVICVVFLGICGVVGEMAFGRVMKTGPLGAFQKVAKNSGRPKLGYLGLVPVVGSLAIAIGYSVVVGWVLKYFFSSVNGALFTLSSQQLFQDTAVSFGSVGWHMLGLGITFLIMSVGVAKGIEAMNQVMMPVFFLFFLILMVRVALLPGAEAGYEYLFVPQWDFLKQPKTWVYALGQAFFSLSVAGSGTVVYGSYLSDDVDVVSCAKRVAFFDTCAALLSGLVVIPAVFAFQLDVASGPPLLFITLPNVFGQMPFSRLFAAIFFLAAFFAAITSLMNLFETPIEALQSAFGFHRRKAVLIVALIAAAVGIFIENGDVVGAWMDVISIYIIPLGALLAAVTLYWVAPKGLARQAVQMGRERRLGAWFEPMTKYAFVLVTLAVYILGIFFGGIG